MSEQEPNIQSAPPVTLTLAATDYVIWANTDNKRAKVTMARVRNPLGVPVTIDVYDGVAGTHIDTFHVPANQTATLTEKDGDTKHWKFGTDVVMQSNVGTPVAVVAVEEL